LRFKTSNGDAIPRTCITRIARCLAMGYGALRHLKSALHMFSPACTRKLEHSNPSTSTYAHNCMLGARRPASLSPYSLAGPGPHPFAGCCPPAKGTMPFWYGATAIPIAALYTNSDAATASCQPRCALVCCGYLVMCMLQLLGLCALVIKLVSIDMGLHTYML
jgi:hypothetical protein